MKHPATRTIPETRRAGISLIEMVVVISIMGVVMSFGVVLLGLLLRAETVGNQALATQLSISRLERQFRTDAHVAVAVESAEDAGTLELNLIDGRRVVWSLAEEGVARQAYDGVTLSAHDEFRLPDGETRFGVESSGRLIELRRRYTLTTPTETPASEGVSPQHDWHIQAAVGIAIVQPANAAIADASQEP